MNPNPDVGNALERYRLAPGTEPDFAAVDNEGTHGLESKEAGYRALEEEKDRLRLLQRMLYARRERSVLLVFQALDAGGKDSAVRRILGGLNPRGLDVTSFKAPTRTELAHDFLWRVHRAAPPTGHIGVFNRSHYEDVLIACVDQLAPPEVIDARYGHINAFEKLLADAGTRIVKVYLHITKEEQKKRFEKRLRRPDKHWKFDPADLDKRRQWNDYLAAFHEALRRCSTPHAPWYIVPGNRKWVRDVIVARILRSEMEAMDLSFPPGPENLDSYEIE